MVTEPGMGPDVTVTRPGNRQTLATLGGFVPGQDKRLHNEAERHRSCLQIQPLHFCS